jgi:hypothetical protein
MALGHDRPARQNFVPEEEHPEKQFRIVRYSSAEKQQEDLMGPVSKTS